MIPSSYLGRPSENNQNMTDATGTGTSLFIFHIG